MLCVNQVMIRETMAFLKDEPPVIIDWLPWNHTFGGNHNLGLVLFNGGTMYLDAENRCPAASRRPCIISARYRRRSTSTFQKARMAAAVSARRRAFAAHVFRQAASDVLFRRGNVALYLEQP